MADDEAAAAQHSVTPFVEWLDEHGESWSSAFAEELSVKIPLLGERPALVRALGAAIASHLPTARSALSGDGAAYRLPRPAREFAHMMAELDAPLSAILRSYDLAHSAVWDEFTEHLRRLDDWNTSSKALALETGSTRMFRYMQAMTGETIEEFDSVRDGLERVTASQRAEIIRRVLTRTGGVSELRDALGYSLSDLHIGYVAWSTDLAHAARTAEAARREVSSVAGQHISIPFGAVVHGWFTPADPQAFGKLRDLALPCWLQMTVGAPRHGHDGFVQTHEEALMAKEMAVLTDTPLRFPDVAVAVLATRDTDLARRFVTDHLGPLLNHEDAERLLETVRAFVDSLGSPTQCSRQLGLHPNTVGQRIHKAERVLGRAIEPGDLALRVALHLVDTAPAVRQQRQRSEAHQ